MKNENFRMVSLGQGPHAWRRAFWIGLVDIAHGVGYRAEYEKMTIAQQIGYEQGRLMTANIRAAGMPPPGWNGSRAGADVFEEEYQHSVKACGHAISYTA